MAFPRNVTRCLLLLCSIATLDAQFVDPFSSEDSIFGKTPAVQNSSPVKDPISQNTKISSSKGINTCKSGSTKIDNCVKCNLFDTTKCDKCEPSKVPTSDNKRCIEEKTCLLGSTKVEHCVLCMPDLFDKTKCYECEPSKVPTSDNKRCIEPEQKTCLVGSTKVEHCTECNAVKKTECFMCDSVVRWPTPDGKGCTLTPFLLILFLGFILPLLCCIGCLVACCVGGFCCFKKAAETRQQQPQPEHQPIPPQGVPPPYAPATQEYAPTEYSKETADV